ncbi:hypothetical protein SBP28_004311 [Candidozyma auris]
MKRKRSRSGCLTCRRRKVKCDETKPACSGCLRSNYKCMWPTSEKESLSHGEEFRLEKVPSAKRYQFVMYRGGDDKYETNNEQIGTDNGLANDRSAKLENEPAWGSAPDNVFLYQAFVDGFLKAVSPQICHPRLSPVANFVPYSMSNPIVMDVVNACAASFLSKANPDMRLESKKRYSICLNNFANSLAKAQSGVEEWMVAAVILLCLRDKFSGSSPIVPASHLAKALEMLRQLRTSGKSSLVSLKFLIESFLFNYTVMLLTGTHEVVSRLPSPFEVYDEWREILDFSPFHHTVPFMKYPIFGAAREAYELAAKVSWLYSRVPLSIQDRAVACDLLRQAYTLPLPILSPMVSEEFAPHEVIHLQESIYLAEILQNCCLLLLHKLLFPGLDRDDPSVQEVVAFIVGKLQEISVDSPVWIICTWPLLVCGIAASSAPHQHYIYASCQRYASKFQMGFLDQISRFLVSVWGTDTEPGMSWNCLLDRDILSRVYL